MLPTHYHQYWSQNGAEHLADYASGTTSWVVGLAPEQAMDLSATQVSQLLHDRLGAESFKACLDPEMLLPSPLAGGQDGEWLKRCHTVGVNVRTIGDFWKVLHYVITLPDHIRGIHLLPIWEPGVVGSLYGMASWELNPEFTSTEMSRMFPGLHRVEDQLAVVVNFLHALGKAVGMDVIPHTDRYSEMVLVNPSYFEWLIRDDLLITDHREHLHEEAEAAILEWLQRRGPAQPAYATVGPFWQLTADKRRHLLFGLPEDYGGRQSRRIDLVDWLFHRGLEPVPATMAPPYRGLEVNPDPSAMTVDYAGRVWRDYKFSEPTEMSRAFGPLTRFKLYGRQNDNQDWAIDFDQPRPDVWAYLTNKYAEQQARYNFDFMRGDMSHVQMRPDGVPETADEWYDPLRAVKLKIQETTPHFAYFAESFLAEPGYMAYGDEVDHLERSEAEVTLGNLQSTVPDAEDFWEMTDHYLRVAASRSVTPAWTVITGDKDDPRFDHFHHHGEMARMFTGLFLGVLPMYYSLGFEQRDRHFERAQNEVYSKLYVFQEDRGDKAVSGPFQWGANLDLFGKLTDLNRFVAGILPHLGPTEFPATKKSVPPHFLGADAGAKKVDKSRVLHWVRPATDGEGAYLFVVSFSPTPLEEVTVFAGDQWTKADLLFSTDEREHEILAVTDGALSLEKLAGGRCYLLG
ncbi:alpha-amylase family protein [Neolewinella persica]|uniref:hypothetical protein n=1 Tax=Neolewinella persica TaxID=70998 RepID=UPI0003798C87|nr:hypothetical protein [Neolewinella persica]